RYLLQGAGLHRSAERHPAARHCRSGADHFGRGAAQETGALIMRLANIGNLGIKELRSLVRDPVMLVLIAYSFTIAIYAAATVMPETLQKAPIAIVDEDRSPLSRRIVDGFALPYFQ